MKKGMLFKFTVAALGLSIAAFVTGCPQKAKVEEKSVIKGTYTIDVPSDRLTQQGLLTPTFQLPERYVNDKVVRDPDHLYYDFYFAYGKANGDKLFSPQNIFAQANVNEVDGPSNNKTKVTYEQLKNANGGRALPAGLVFTFGVKVFDQSSNPVAELIEHVTVHGPKNVKVIGGGKVELMGEHPALAGSTFGGKACTVEVGSDKTTLTFTGAGNKADVIKYAGGLGESAKVIIK